MSEVDSPKREASSLINRNIVINGRRTSVRLEGEMWNDLRDIGRREGRTIHELCTKVDGRKPSSRSLTSAIRVFIIAYYRSAATEEGHDRAGHGENYKMSMRVRHEDGVIRRPVSDMHDNAGYELTEKVRQLR